MPLYSRPALSLLFFVKEKRGTQSVWAGFTLLFEKGPEERNSVRTAKGCADGNTARTCSFFTAEQELTLPVPALLKETAFLYPLSAKEESVGVSCFS